MKIYRTLYMIIGIYAFKWKRVVLDPNESTDRITA